MKWCNGFDCVGANVLVKLVEQLVQSQWCNSGCAPGGVAPPRKQLWQQFGQQPADLTTRDYKGHQLTDQTSLQSLQSSIQEYIIHGKMICCPDLLLILVVLDDKSRFCYNSNETVDSLGLFTFTKLPVKVGFFLSNHFFLPSQC